MNKFITEKLKKKGKSKAWLARQMGISPQNLNGKIKESHTWSLPDYLKVLDALGVIELEILESIKKIKKG
jgi:lambda repressor-like predicted transcriptional regulator